MFSPEFFWLIIYLRLPLVRCRTLFIIYFRYSVLIEMELIYLWITSQSLYKSLLRESFLLNYSRKLGLFKLIDWIIFLLIKLYFVIYLKDIFLYPTYILSHMWTVFIFSQLLVYFHFYFYFHFHNNDFHNCHSINRNS